MRKHILYITVTIIFSFCIIFVLLFFSVTHDKNGFNRSIRTSSLQIKAILKLPSEYFYFAGTRRSIIYLRDLEHIGHIYSCTPDLERLLAIDLNMNMATRNKQGIKSGVQQDRIFTTYFNSGELDIITMDHLRKYKYNIPAYNFDQASLISESLIAGREIYSNRDTLLRRISVFNYIHGSKQMTLNLEKQVDGYFCVDGMLQFDPQSSKLFYLYYYRGSFLSLDTNLKVQYQGKTIDTVITAKVEKREVKESNSKTGTTMVLAQATPPRLVNRNYTLYNKKLYVFSALKADNESYSIFRDNQVVDVYNLNNGVYSYSFYIPNYKGKKARQMIFSNGLLYVLFADRLVKYSVK